MSARPRVPRPGWLLLLVLSPALLWGCWRAPFLAQDDLGWIARNPLLAPETPWTQLWRPHPQQQFYYPLTLLSWRVDRVVWGEGWAGLDAWPAGIRTTNLLLHLAAAVLLWRIVRRLGAGKGVAGLVLAAFTLHPLACESVCWAVERKNVLAGALGFAAVWAYLRARRAAWPGPALSWHAGAAVFYAAALLAKPSALGLLPVVAAWELLGCRAGFSSAPAPQTSAEASGGLEACPTATGRLEDPKGEGCAAAADRLEVCPTTPRRLEACATALARLTPWILLAGLFAWIGAHMHAAAQLPPPGGSLWTALLTDVAILWRYVQNLVWPANLSAYYGFAPVVSLGDLRLWTGATGLAGLAALTWWLAEKESRRLVVFGWLWFLGALLPFLNFAGLSDLLHDRFLYLAAPGFWLALGLALAGAWWRWAPAAWREVLGRTPAPLRARFAAALPLTLVALGWTAASAARSELFSGTRYLFADAARKEPQSSWARIFWSWELEKEARRQAGADLARRRALSGPALRESEAGMRETVDNDRFLHQPHAHRVLAELYLLHGRRDEARGEALAVVSQPQWMRVTPDDRAFAEGLLGTAAEREQRLAFEALTRRQPLEALEHFDRALRYAPELTSIHFQRARVLESLQVAWEKQGEMARAQVLYEEAVRALHEVQPDAPEYQNAQQMLKQIRPPGAPIPSVP